MGRCQRCDDPMCDRCHTPTAYGVWCPGCARTRHYPGYAIDRAGYARAAALGLLAAVGFGLLWELVPVLAAFALFVMAVLGYVIGEAVSLGAGRRTSRPLRGIVVATVCLAFVLARTGVPWLPWLPDVVLGAPSPPPLSLTAWSQAVLTQVLLSPIAWAVIAGGSFIALTRTG
jgi:hypothetical protein